MASFALTSTIATFYDHGDETSSRVVGYESSHRRVARYPILSPAEGASHIDITFYTQGLSDGTQIPVRFYIGTDPDSHINAGAESEYHGVLTLNSAGDTFTGSADVLLLPNTQYYLFFFPGQDKYGYYRWYGSSIGASAMETTGGAGLVQIDTTGAGLEPYQVYIDTTGAGFELYMPYIDNGSSWELYTG